MSFRLSKNIDIATFHTYLTAQSGAGKSQLTILRILTHAKELYEHPKGNISCLRVVDPKAGKLYSLRHSLAESDRQNFGTTPDDCVKLLEEHYAEITRRGKLFDNPDVGMDDELDLPPCLIFIDEFVDIMEQARITDKKIANKIQSLLVSCITKGRELKCYIWITAMRADTTNIPGLVRSTMLNVTLATAGREPDPENIRMIFGSGVKLISPPVGTKFYGYAKSEGGQPTLFLTPTFSDKTDVRGLLTKYLYREK